MIKIKLDRGADIVTCECVEDLDDTDRGADGFGSTGY